MASISVVDSKWDIVDDTEWTDDWVGLSWGDLYEGDKPFGHYVAAWYPNCAKPAQILITAVNEKLEGVMAVAFHCGPSDSSNLRPVEPEDVPWEYDGVAFGPIVRTSELDRYSRTKEIIGAAQQVVLRDEPLKKYLSDPTIRLTAS